MNHEESSLQAQIVSVLSLAGVFLFAVPNEAAGKSTPQKMSRLLAMGLRAGVSDLVLVGQGRVFFLEIKTETGKQSKKQIDFQAKVESLGHTYAIARSVEESLALARSWGLVNGS